MTVQPDLLLSELRALCRGPGMQAPAIDRQVGPALQEVCGITGADGAETVRNKIRAWVDGIVERFPLDLRLTVTAPLALHEGAQYRFLNERVDWLAAQQERGARTMRRRIDEGLIRLVEAALDATPQPAPRSREDGWRVSDFEAVLRLDGTTPSCTERRTLVADCDGIDRITWSISIPAATGDGAPADLDVEVLHGVELLSTERPSPRRFLLHLKLPRTLRAGEAHRFSLHVQVPEGQPMRPTYVFWPERPCDHFNLVVRFPSTALPASVWRVDGAFHRDIDDLAEGRDLVRPNGIGEVEVDFSGLRPDRGYGIQWRPADTG
ncbi:hypothetical protein FHS29_006195 [Saccharothrix tamanrassetensis]|uniref:Uncharacterized protein n=1 Tax=Saccharothrix tamanrassetensis TaxID=1051531 RepID=A0A841CTD1_9PSEU|nr:hypothetical protein [Saccharothrix tamanrassetensis]MBB5959574.1 hypothetical protein [Saccharothrix tamanrassetensis]